MGMKDGITTVFAHLSLSTQERENTLCDLVIFPVTDKCLAIEKEQ